MKAQTTWIINENDLYSYTRQGPGFWLKLFFLPVVWFPSSCSVSQYGLHGFAYARVENLSWQLVLLYKGGGGTILQSLERWVPKDCMKEILQKAQGNTSNYIAINTIAIVASWCWKPETHVHMNGQTHGHTPQKAHSNTCIFCDLNTSSWEVWKTNKKKKHTSGTDVKNAYLNILESHSFPADFSYSGNRGFDGNILDVALSLNSLNWVN